MTTHAASPARYSAHRKARGRASPLPPSYTIRWDVTGRREIGDLADSATSTICVLTD